jgi:hypothetical protein
MEFELVEEPLRDALEDKDFCARRAPCEDRAIHIPEQEDG